MEKSEYYDNGIDTRTGLPCGETEDDTLFLGKVVKRMRILHEEFKEKYGHEPIFANVKARFDGEDEEFADFIKLRDYDLDNTENDPYDGLVIYFAEGIDGLCGINTDRTADFVITQILGFQDDI